MEKNTKKSIKINFENQQETNAETNKDTKETTNCQLQEHNLNDLNDKEVKQSCALDHYWEKLRGSNIQKMNMDTLQDTEDFKRLVESNKHMEKRITTTESLDTNNGPTGMIFEKDMVDIDEVKEKLINKPIPKTNMCKQPELFCDDSNYNFNKDIRSYNVGNSDYSHHKIQPWDIWEDYNLNPWDADIVKRVLRKKDLPGLTDTQSRIEDYQKIIHICLKRIQQLEHNKNID